MKYYVHVNGSDKSFERRMEIGKLLLYTQRRVLTTISLFSGGWSRSSSRYSRLAPSRRVSPCIQFTGERCCKVRLPPKTVSRVRSVFDPAFCRFDDCFNDDRYDRFRDRDGIRHIECLYKRR